MLLSVVRDTTGELARCKRPEPATCPGPAQTQPQGARQAELVICDKTIERPFAWLTHWGGLLRDRAERLDVAASRVACAAVLAATEALINPQ
ncbi:hypothetical protein GCM10011504_50090 [Siccirubricoccus deserti]|nr:hypothetical protein GCM10011504_50090 [Siccirubricoccus deserti]